MVEWQAGHFLAYGGLVGTLDLAENIFYHRGYTSSAWNYLAEEFQNSDLYMGGVISDNII